MPALVHSWWNYSVHRSRLLGCHATLDKKKGRSLFGSPRVAAPSPLMGEGQSFPFGGGCNYTLAYLFGGALGGNRQYDCEGTDFRKSRHYLISSASNDIRHNSISRRPLVQRADTTFGRCESFNVKLK